MPENFTQKEMLIRMMNKLDIIESKLNDTHEQARVTNGKVRLHTKLIFGLFGALTTIVSWFIISTLRGI